MRERGMERKGDEMDERYMEEEGKDRVRKGGGMGIKRVNFGNVWNC
jgi:hypothetical protein